MKTSLGSWRTFLVLLIATAFPDDVYGTVKPCDHNKEREVTAEDAITLVRPLLCEKPLVRVRRRGTAASRLPSCRSGSRFRCCIGVVGGDVDVSVSNPQCFI